MDQMSYFEKLENLYVLKETRQMLLKKLQETNPNTVLHHVISDDLNKIEQEMTLYTDGQTVEVLDKAMTSSLMNPAIYYELDED
ncbi:hypothetical protein J2S74_002031 [Evansella vedderi]|uniref:Uncharacterized protein n=1 Tax=Evansella vedderi TaxID=38282 RepID=A0ABT9ZV91_9BACI|nr:hypothetical protein [Evansella vedderi]MDQ0254652.1 hypothetical protein [Evansella vedderi]